MNIEKPSFGQVKVTATGFFSLFSIVGIAFYGLPFFYDFWVQDYGWSRATVTSGNAFGKIFIGMFAFIAGWVIDRFGPRRIMLSGILMGGIALIGLSVVTTIWHFYFFYLISALGYMCGGPLPNQVLISRWFTTTRGKAMGIAYLGIGFGGMLVPQLAKKLNLEFGWHQSLMLLGILMILIAFPMIWFVSDNPEDAKNKHQNETPKVPLGTILKGWPFYLLLIGSICSIGAVAGTSQNLKLFFSIDLKYTQQQSANVISLVLAASIIGRLLMGWLADRIPKKYVMILIYAIVAGSIPLLYLASTPGVIYLFAFIFGIGLGGDYMIIPLMAAELFGVKVMGRIMGIILTFDGLSEAFSPMMVGWMRDKGGTYANGFATLMVLGAIGIIAVSFLPKENNKI
ncbi:major facilitator superfamily MFS_1 [Aquipluma nitroreducens]|uniref:Major facilitator superfamily MFS_1 n=1 Tax=Aquipluma nitroreducens TaxID=2010828 RepID=A0A5K7SFJ8_9BACT|nr:MFS transporter [Aquipluma nitroreducens]BBE20246.1 major facilitator superfamily MFS_1 [Aquipluma nitroreducens]